MAIRVFLLDDHEIVRRGVRDLLESEPDITVVGEAATSAEALERIAGAEPDVALLDVQLEQGTGIEVAREIRSSHPDVACLMLTSFADDEALFDSLMAGAAGYVLKQVRGNELIDGVRVAAAGRSLLDPNLTRQVLNRLRSEDREADRGHGLTNQEGRILELLAEGLTNRQIGERMGLAEKTIKNYVSNVLMKLGMERRTEAAVYAARQADRVARAGGGSGHRSGPLT